MASTKFRAEAAECTSKCRSKGDAAALISAVTQNESEAKLLHHLATAGICSQPGRVSDALGRQLLHVAASAGRRSVVEWLVRFREAAINAKDSESGYTALHRALFSGQIGVAEYLVSAGANAAICDHDGLTPYDHVVADRRQTDLLTNLSAADPCDVYAWGSNANYNLGIGHQQRQSPDVLEYFRREGVHVRKIALQKFHSAFLSSSGQVFTCGHGRGGRLGHGDEEAQLAPRQVKDIQPCSDVALGVDHTVLLTTAGTVLTCGTNLHHQLGQSPAPKVSPTPQPIALPKQCGSRKVVGVGASRFHSLFWTEDAVFTWGLNAGQLGHLKGDRTVNVPKIVASLNDKNLKIDRVSTSQAAIVVLTRDGEIIALHEYRTRRITIRQFGVVKIEVLGGHLDPKVDSSGSGSSDSGYKLVERGGQDLKVFVLNSIGKISVWEEERSGSQLFSCVFNINRELSIADMAVSGKGGSLMLVTKDGLAFEGTHISKKSSQKQLQPPPKKSSKEESSSLSAFVARNQFDTIKLKRLPGIYRAASCAADPKGQNFCVLQVLPNASLYEVPEVSAQSIASDMDAFREQASEMDAVCDVVFVLSSNSVARFPAHKYVMASASDKIAKMLRSVVNGKEVQVDDVGPDAFAEIVKYAYTKTCDLLKPGQCPARFLKSRPNGKGDQCNDACGSPEPIVENPHAVSAFAVNKSKKDKLKGRKAADKVKEKQTPLQAGDNPLESLSSAARNLAVHGLVKALENFKMSSDGRTIMLKENGKQPRAQPCFSRKSFPEFHDVVIVSEEGEEIPCHRCLLSARSEYFMSMFGLGWIETSGSNRTLNLPMPAKVLVAMTDFLYRDESAGVSGSDDTEFLCNLLVAADQLLLGRLVELCERQLAQLLTLKNAGQVLRFAFDYGAKQLGRSAMQFLSQNMAVALESRILAGLSNECLAELTEYYQDSIPAMARRRITPYSGRHEMRDTELNVEDIVREEEAAIVAAATAAATATTPSAGGGGSASKKRNRRNSSGERPFRFRRDSTSSNASVTSDSSGGSDRCEQDSREGSLLSLEDFEFEEKRGGSDDQDANTKSVNEAQEGTAAATAGNNFLASFFLQKATPPQQRNNGEMNAMSGSKKFVKKSQKDRKRELEERANRKEPSNVASSPVTNWTGWGADNGKQHASPSPVTLADIMSSEEAKVVGGTKPKTFSGGRSKKASWRQLSFTDEDSALTSPTPQTPQNPWKTLPQPASPPGGGDPDPDLSAPRNFSTIVKSQEESRAQRRQLSTKSLQTLQIEELAISQLLAASNTNAFETVKVVRVEKPMDPPVWNWASKK